MRDALDYVWVLLIIAAAGAYLGWSAAPQINCWVSGNDWAWCGLLVSDIEPTDCHCAACESEYAATCHPDHDADCFDYLSGARP